MSINIIVYFLMLFGAYFIFTDITPKTRKRFIIYCSVILLLKAALRSVTVGVDTSHYSGYFYESMNRSWTEIFNMILYENSINDIEGGYKLIEKIFSSFLPNFNLYTFFVQGLLYYLPLGVLMYRETSTKNEVLLGYVLLNALFMGLPMANARQVYAIGFCFWAYMFMLNKKLLYAMACVLVAYTIHHSALLFLLVLPVIYVPLRIHKNIVFGAIALVPIVLSSVNAIILYMGTFVGSDKYAGYADETAGGALTYISLSVLLCVFVAVALNKHADDSIRSKLMFSMVTLTALSAPLIYSNGTMIRIAMYFQLFFVVMLPNMVEAYFGQHKKTVYVILIGILIVLSIMSEMPYTFFWEEDQNPYRHWS